MPRISFDRFLWKSKGYVTYRRFLLDTLLSEYSGQMRGMVIDLGGKRKNKRGTFLPPENQADAWLYINLDTETRPNIFADVTSTPLQGHSVDCILCTEVLEHLPNPQACVDEIYRLLCHSGVAYVSVPFFYPVHADPYDFQRYTEDGLRHLFRKFSHVEIRHMGGYLGTIGLMLELGVIEKKQKPIAEKIGHWVMKWLSRLFIYYDLEYPKKDIPEWRRFTTGYFVVAQR